MQNQNTVSNYLAKRGFDWHKHLQNSVFCFPFVFMFATLNSSFIPKLHFHIVIIEQSSSSHLTDLIATQTVYNQQTFQFQPSKMEKKVPERYVTKKIIFSSQTFLRSLCRYNKLTPLTPYFQYWFFLWERAPKVKKVNVIYSKSLKSLTQ